MQEFIYGVYDEKVKAFLPVFVLPNHAVAVRAIKDCVNDSNHQFGAHPEDYFVYCLGEWNKETGRIDGYHLPDLIVRCAELRDGLDFNPSTEVDHPFSDRG